MKKILSSIIYCLLFTISLPTPATAADDDVIDIVFNGTTAFVTIPASAKVQQMVSGAHVTLNSTTTSEEYIYRVSGYTPDGALTIIGNYKLTLQLNGVNITSTSGAAIDVQCGKRIAVDIVKGTTNTLVDGTAGSQKAALYFKGHAEFEGGGTLNVTGRKGHAIGAKEYLEIKKDVGTINILSAAKDGINCGKNEPNSEHSHFQISGGVVNINNTVGDCLDCGDYGVMYIKGGLINANVTTAEAAGLKCDSVLYMSGGELNINVTAQQAEGIRTNYDALFTGGMVRIAVGADGAKGIKSKCMTKSSATVKNGGYLHFAGTQFEINVFANDIKDEGVVTTNCRAVSADADITRSGGLIDIYAYGDIDNAYNSDTQEIVEGGELNLRRAPWTLHYGNHPLDMTMYCTLQVNGKPAAPDEFAVAAFIDGWGDTPVGTHCDGVADNGYMRIYADSRSSYYVNFKAYEFSTGKIYTLGYSGITIYFQPNKTWGSPSEPIVLTALKGDVSNDYKVDNDDVTALVEIITGRRTSIAGVTNLTDVADLNGDHRVTVADLTTLIRLLH